MGKEKHHDQAGAMIDFEDQTGWQQFFWSTAFELASGVTWLAVTSRGSGPRRRFVKPEHRTPGTETEVAMIAFAQYKRSKRIDCVLSGIF
jgi:hypothetical protein